MSGPSGCRTGQQIDAEHRLAEFIQRCQAQAVSPDSDACVDWDSAEWPGVRWTRVGVGKRRQLFSEDCLDREFVQFAKAYYWRQRTERRTQVRWYVQALRCIEAALVASAGTGAVSGLTWAVLDEAAEVARQHFSPGVQYHIGREIAGVACYVSREGLVPRGLLMWKSPFERPVSVPCTGRAARERARAKLPSKAGIAAMAEIFANDAVDTQARFVSAVWVLLMNC